MFDMDSHIHRRPRPLTIARQTNIGERTGNEAIGRGRDVHFALETCIYCILLLLLLLAAG